MDVSKMYINTPLYLSCGLVLMFIYPVISIFLFRSRRVSRVIAIMLPLFGGGMLGWIGLRMAFMGMAISGGRGIASVAAGIAEALMAVTVGAAASCVTGVIALIFASTTGAIGVQHPSRRRYSDVTVASLGLLFVVALLVVVVILLRGEGWHPDPQTLAGIVTLGGWSGLAILIASFATLRSRGVQPLSLTFGAFGVSLIIGIATWLLQRRIMMSAMTGQLPF